MLPTCARNNQAYSSSTHAKTRRNGALFFSFSRETTNLYYNVLCKFGICVTASTRSSHRIAWRKRPTSKPLGIESRSISVASGHASSSHGVSGVFGRVAKPKMSWVDASWLVARVKHHPPVRIGAAGQFIRKAMRRDRASTNGEHAVTLCSYSPGPIPALPGPVNECPEPLSRVDRSMLKRGATPLGTEAPPLRTGPRTPLTCTHGADVNTGASAGNR